MLYYISPVSGSRSSSSSSSCPFSFPSCSLGLHSHHSFIYFFFCYYNYYHYLETVYLNAVILPPLTLSFISSSAFTSISSSLRSFAPCPITQSLLSQEDTDAAFVLSLSFVSPGTRCIVSVSQVAVWSRLGSAILLGQREWVDWNAGGIACAWPCDIT